MGIRETPVNAVASNAVREAVKAADGAALVPETLAVLEDADTSDPERAWVLPDEHPAGIARRATMTKVTTLRSRG
jgi:hypothetical protein